MSLPLHGRLLLDFAKLGFRDVAMLGYYRYQVAQPPLRPHVHRDIYEICILEQGTRTHFVGSRRFDLVGGDAIITKPGEIHSTGNEPEHKGRLFWLQFRSPSQATLLGLSSQESALLLRRLVHLPNSLIHHAEALIPTLKRIFDVFASPRNPMQATDLRNLLVRFLLDFLSLAEQNAASHLDPGILRTLKWIEHTLSSPASPKALGVRELASVARLSESYFQKRFAEQVGMPPVEYVVHRRIELSKQLLHRPELPITQIALDAGFATSQHFSTTFKRLTGMTPRKFRQEAQRDWEANTPPEDGCGVAFHPTVSPPGQDRVPHKRAS